MKCPKTFHSESVIGASEQWVWEDCLKKECAWWDRGSEECGVLSLTGELHWLKEIWSQIRDKMPHAGQFLTKP